MDGVGSIPLGGQPVYIDPVSSDHIHQNLPYLVFVELRGFLFRDGLGGVWLLLRNRWILGGRSIGLTCSIQAVGDFFYIVDLTWNR